MPSPTGDIASAVRAEAARARMSGRALAATIGMTPWSLHRRLNGTVPFTGDDLVVISRALDIPVERFFAAVAA